MKLCRFEDPSGRACAGLLADDSAVLDLTAAGIDSLTTLFEQESLPARMEELARQTLRRHELKSVRLLPPVERQEVWAAGVTYLRSKSARMAESDFSATAYDKVYDAARPELFFKALPQKVAGPMRGGTSRSPSWRWS